MLFLFCSLLWLPASAANDRQEDEAATAAEYIRLRQDLRRYAERQLWGAVERTYQRCMSLYPDDGTSESGWGPPTPMDQRDHLQAAAASMARGDLYTTRQRLVRAVRKEETTEALDLLWGIDTAYSEVQLRAAPGTELIPSSRPFDPVLASAITFAQQELAQTGSFHGLLPRMPYRLGDHRFEVRGGQGLTTVDLVGEAPQKKRRSRRK